MITLEETAEIENEQIIIRRFFLFIFLLVVNLFHRTCFTIVSVPYSSLTARITDDSDERTKLTTARMLAASFGTFSISALAFPIVLFFGGGEESLGFIYLGKCFKKI